MKEQCLLKIFFLTFINHTQKMNSHQRPTIIRLIINNTDNAICFAVSSDEVSAKIEKKADKKPDTLECHFTATDQALDSPHRHTIGHLDGPHPLHRQSTAFSNYCHKPRPYASN
jgi:hypothetical protein